MNRSFAKENTPPNIMIPKSTMGLSKPLQLIQTACNNKNSKAIRSKTPPDLHYSQQGFQSGQGLPFSGKLYNIEDLNINMTTNNISHPNIQANITDDVVNLSRSSNNIKPTIVTAKLQAAQKQTFSSDVAKKNRELLGYLNFAAQENTENLKKIVKLGANEFPSGISGNANYGDNIRESIVDSNSSRRRVMNVKRTENDNECINPLRYSLENYSGDIEKQNIINKIIKNNGVNQINNNNSKNKVPSSAETVKLLMQIKNNDSSVLNSNNNNQPAPYIEEIDNQPKFSNKSKENLRHSLENSMWVLQKHQKNLSTNDQQRGFCNNAQRKLVHTQMTKPMNNISAITAKERIATNIDEATQNMEYYMSYPQQSKNFRESIAGANGESLTQIIQKTSAEEPQMIAPMSRKHSTENSKVRHSCEGLFNNKQSKSNMLLSTNVVQTNVDAELHDRQEQDAFEIINNCEFLGKVPQQPMISMNKQSQQNMKKDEMYSNRLNENIIKKMLSKDEIDSLKDENKNIMSNLKKTNIELEQMKHINSQLENGIAELKKKTETDTEKLNTENSQLKSKVIELQKYHDFLINEKKKVMKFENEIIIKDSQLSDYRTMFKETIYSLSEMLGITKRLLSEKDLAVRRVAQIQSILFSTLNNLNPIILELNMQNEIKNTLWKESASITTLSGVNIPDHKVRSRNNSSSSHSSKLSGETNASLLKSPSICSNNMVSHMSRNETDTSMNNAISYNNSAHKQPNMQNSSNNGSNSKCKGNQNFSKVYMATPSTQAQVTSNLNTPQQTNMNSSKKLSKNEISHGLDLLEDSQQNPYNFQQLANLSFKTKDQQAVTNSQSGLVAGNKAQVLGNSASLPPQVPNQNSSKKIMLNSNSNQNFYCSPQFCQGGGSNFEAALGEVENGGGIFSNSQSDISNNNGITNNEDTALKILKNEECSDNNTMIEHDSVSHKENFLYNLASDNESQKMDDFEHGSFRTLNNNNMEESRSHKLSQYKEISQTLTETYVYSENKNISRPDEDHPPPNYDMFKRTPEIHQPRMNCFQSDAVFSVPKNNGEHGSRETPQLKAAHNDDAVCRGQKFNKQNLVYLNKNKDEVQEGVDEGDLYVAKFDFKPQKANDLQFSKGDHIQIVKKISNGWWIGVLKKSGDMGYVPSNFLECVHSN